jgi:hypothetical protein
MGDVVKRLATIPLISQPGESWEYGLSTDVLGYLIEVVSGTRQSHENWRFYVDNNFRR